jgi:hypothetical protein
METPVVLDHSAVVLALHTDQKGFSCLYFPLLEQISALMNQSTISTLQEEAVLRLLMLLRYSALGLNQLSVQHLLQSHLPIVIHPAFGGSCIYEMFYAQEL